MVHPLEPDENVLKGVVEGVSDVQDTCDIGRWDDYAVRGKG
jgi:hypothetical protein